MADQQFAFAAFRLDSVNQQLWEGEALVPLRPKLFSVLRHLVEHAGRLVTREELRTAAWSTTAVSESVLRGTIRELRDVLGDDATAARFVETVPHRGYRFVAPVTVTRLVRAQAAGAPLVLPQESQRAQNRILIGRDAELTRLRDWLESCVRGTRRIVFLSGEPGIGKTTVVDAFLSSAVDTHAVWTARGQCIEHYGASEAYLPVLEALGQLCRRPYAERVIGVLRRYAPTWLIQMPGVLGDAEHEAIRARAQGATRERMLRELADAVEALTADTPLVLVLEDLQWSDVSTLDLFSSLAQRREPARLLLLATYRPADVIVSGHPLNALKQELRIHQQCEELALGFLSHLEIGQYLAARFPNQHLPPELGQVIHHGTEGNPLFMVNVVDYWVSQRRLIETAGQWRLAVTVDNAAADVPDSLRQMIEKQLARLTREERRLLEAASVAGAEFSAAAAAAALEEPADDVEELCEELAGREQFLRARGTDVLTDGAVTGRYAFLHALYQQVLYDRVAPVRRSRWHRRIGEWGARALNARVKDPAAELAMHFERGQDHPQAVEYLTQAAQNALRRQAPHEAVALLGKALALLNNLPGSRGRAQHELALLVTSGVPLLMTRGYAAEEVERTYSRAHELCRQLGEGPELLPALAGLFRFYLVRAEFQTACAVGEQILRLAQHTEDPIIFLVAHSLLGAAFLSLGEFVTARAHLEKGIALYDPRAHRFMAPLYGDDPGVTCRCFGAMSLWFLGYPDQALMHVQQALELARGIDSPYSETFALDFLTWIHVLRREEHAVLAANETLLRIASEQGFPFLLADGRILHGWILAAQGMAAEGLREMQPAIAAYEATGAVMSKPAHLLLLSNAYRRAEQIEAGLAALGAATAAMEHTGERTYAGEMDRLRGDLTLATSHRARGKRQVPANIAEKAETCFQKAIQLARDKQAKSLELRAAVSLSRLWQRQGKRRQARAILGEIYGWFTEGFETADLRDAKALLEELG